MGITKTKERSVMNIRFISELTHLSKLLNNQPQKNEKEQKMKNRKVSQNVVLVILLALSLFLTSCVTDTLAAEKVNGTNTSTVYEPVVVLFNGGEFSGDDFYDPAVSLSPPALVFSGKNNFSGDDAYDPASGGLTR
jgi:hypothetical protein